MPPVAQTTPSLLAPEKQVRDAIFATLLPRQLKAEELAAAIDRSYSHVGAVIRGDSDCKRTRRLIENYLRQAFWSSPRDFAERLALIDFYGADLEVLTMLELRDLCLKHRLLGTRTTNLPRGFFLDHLMIHYHGARAVPPQDNASQTNETIETRPQAAAQSA